MANSSGNIVAGILFDLDGVLYSANQVIEGAAAAVAWVEASGIPYLFVTNTTSRPRASLAEKLLAFGFAATEDQILTPAVAAAQWLSERHARQVALFVRPAVRVDFAAISCLPETAEQDADYVVIGDLGELWDYRTLNRAFRLLHSNPKAVLVALGMTRYWRTGDGISLDVAPFVAALECATGRPAQVLGKPAVPFFQAASKRLGFPEAQIIMLGDDIEADIGGAQSAGLKGALVRTGKFRAGDLDGPIHPDVVLNSVADLPAYLTTVRT